jgi:acetyltransferase
VNIAAVEEALLRTSDMVCELPEIQELDINPLIADENGVMAVDARIIVARVRPGSARYGHMAIHPYPIHLTSHLQLPDGTDVRFRPIRPEDAEIEASFVRGLSTESKYFRFMQTLTELTQEMLVRFTQIDYDREMAFIALVDEGGKDREVAVGRYVTNPDRKTCEFALVVTDQWQRKGIGTHLMTQLIEYARTRGLSAMDGEVLTLNRAMLDLVQHLGFEARTCPEDPAVQLVSRPL